MISIPNIQSKTNHHRLLYTDKNYFSRFNSQLAEWANKRTNKAGDMTETAAAPAAATAAGILPPQDQRKYYGNYGELQNLEDNIIFSNVNRLNKKKHLTKKGKFNKKQIDYDTGLL